MYKVVDLFCGCGGGALGIESTNKFKTILAIDNMDSAVNTYNQNLKEKVTINKDITTISEEEFKKLVNYETVDVLMGSPPCVGFSMITRNSKTHFTKTNREEKNSLVYYYLKAVKAYKPKICVIENVSGLLSMKNKNGNLIINEIEKAFNELGYYVKYKLIDVSKLGLAQRRKRVIIIASNNKELLDKFKYPEEKETDLTVRDVIEKYEHFDLNENINHITTKLKTSTIKRIELIKPGGCILDIPENHELKTKAKFSNSYKRLVYDTKCNTIINVYKTIIIHPTKNRILTVRECLALQGFKDDFIFNNNITTSEQYLMVANAIPPILTQRVFENIYEILKGEK